MPKPTAYWWSKVPFVRLLIFLVAGIILQWRLQVPFRYLLFAFAVAFSFIIVYSVLSLRLKFQKGFLSGLAILFLVVSIGGILVWLRDVRHNKAWIGNHYSDSSYLLATIEEPLVEKTNSFKALGSVQSVLKNNSPEAVEGKIILYFKKDSSTSELKYGSQIIFKKPLQEIRNSGNPAAFNYKQYSLFQGITHQVFLSSKDFELLPVTKRNWFDAFIFSCRDWVIGVLRKYIHGEKEQGLAEALLIGYKDDLDKNLVQSYSNTGVVHVIAISGLHLGLIYWLLLMITKPMKRKKQLVWLRLLIILASLWLFSFLAGAQPSVLRSAVMFSFIAVGEVIDRRTSVYNTLALSAFCLLCYNPFWLWDVGFQLSYAAVLSIITFFRPIYNWFYFPNKILDFVWKLNAVTLSAQLLTMPISIYHFHQVPTLFLFTNLVAVPLSSIILMGEILLCVICFVPTIAQLLGSIIEWMIWCMNSYIERFDSVSFSIWNGLSITIFQAMLLVAFTVLTCFWLMEKRKALLWISLCCLLLFMAVRSYSFIKANDQKKMIVYNVPKHQAIDVIDGRSYHFIGDTDLLSDDFLRNFHLQPSRIENRIEAQGSMTVKDFQFYHNHVCIIDTTLFFSPTKTALPVDVLILSKNPKLYISNLMKSLAVKQIVIDGSVPQWKAKFWKKDCDSLHIPCYDVSEQGAYVMEMN